MNIFSSRTRPTWKLCMNVSYRTKFCWSSFLYALSINKTTPYKITNLVCMDNSSLYTPQTEALMQLEKDLSHGKIVIVYDTYLLTKYQFCCLCTALWPLGIFWSIPCSRYTRLQVIYYNWGKRFNLRWTFFVNFYAIRSLGVTLSYSANI